MRTNFCFSFMYCYDENYLKVSRTILSLSVFVFCNFNYQVFYPRKASRCVSQVTCLIYLTLRAEGNVQ